MWIRNKNYMLVEIKRLDYLTDTDYYNAIIKEKFGFTIKQNNNTIETIINLIGYKNS